jgi:branched-chain amino acid transport system substrate-binding protein
VLAAKSANADCIAGATSVADSIGLVREINRQGLKPKLLAMSIGTSEPTFQSSLENLANGVIGNTQWWPSLKRPGNKEFVAAYRKTFNGDPDYHVALSYSAIQVLAAAVTQVKSIDQTKIRAALGNLKIKTISGPFKVNSEGLQSGYKTYFMQWQNGKPYLVWPSGLAERKLKLPYS